MSSRQQENVIVSAKMRVGSRQLHYSRERYFVRGMIVSGGSRISQTGAQPQMGRQDINRSNLSKNRMKIKKIEPRRGCASLDPPPQIRQ